MPLDIKAIKVREKKMHICAIVCNLNKYEYEHIWVDTKKINTDMNKFGVTKRANLNTNMNIRTDICKYDYKYEY